MTDDLTSLSTREMDRLQVVLRIADRRLTQSAGAKILGISERQVRRICRRLDEANRYLPEFMDDYNRRFARAARNDHDAHRPLLERDCLDDIFTWQETRRVTAQLTVHHKRTVYVLEPTDQAKTAAKKRVTVVEHKLLGAALAHIRHQQEAHETERLRSAKTKRDRTLVRKHFRDPTSLPGE